MLKSFNAENPLYLQGLTPRQIAKTLIRKNVDKPLRRLYQTNDAYVPYVDVMPLLRSHEVIIPTRVKTGYKPLGDYARLYFKDIVLPADTTNLTSMNPMFVGIKGMGPADVPEGYAYGTHTFVGGRRTLYHRLSDRASNQFTRRAFNRYAFSTICGLPIPTTSSIAGAYTGLAVSSIIPGQPLLGLLAIVAGAAAGPMATYRWGQSFFNRLPAVIEIGTRRVERLGVKSLYRLASFLPN